MPIRCSADSLDLSILTPSPWPVFLQAVRPQPLIQVHEATAQARDAASRGDLSAAIEAQERAVAHLRSSATEDRDTLVRLSVILYNLAGYYSQAGRWDDAVAAFEEVVALDERTGHEDLASDREALERARHMASLYARGAIRS